jgi:hypothetical protein
MRSKKVSVMLWIACPLVLAIGGYLATSGRPNSLWAAAFGTDPAISYPAELDLGEHEIGDQILTPFVIMNRGNGELLVDGIESSCSCTGMEIQKDGDFVRLESFRVKPHEQIELAIRVSVPSGVAGEKMTNFVFFHTNDPLHKECTISAVVQRVYAGVSSFPHSVAIGTVAVGGRITRLVEIRDTALKARRVNRVTSSDPSRVSARWLPRHEKDDNKYSQPEGKLLGEVEIQVDAATPGVINAAINLELERDQKRPDTIRVVGEVAGAVQCHPPLLILPRVSSNGILDTATCFVESSSGKKIELSAETLSDILGVEVLKANQGKPTSIQVMLKKAKGASKPMPRREIIRIRARAVDEETILDLPVIVP